MEGEDRQAVPFSELTKPGAPLGALVREHEETIEDIGRRGGIAVVVFEPADTWRIALARHGWAGEPVFPMARALRRAMGKSDPVTERWASTPRSGTTRIFAVIHAGSLLVNKTAEGLSVEPGSTDLEGQN